MKDWVITRDRFYPGARSLRRSFDALYQGGSRRYHPDRFVWDFWNIPHAYTYLRTPALKIFPDAVIQPFFRYLSDWGFRTLGCDQFTGLWLSAYIQGCEQNLHADRYHGPWAFVFSLTRWQERVFSGGETLVMRPELLDYWRNQDITGTGGPRNFFDVIPSLFNRLVVFDPRVPHGVRTVQGTMDPAQGRLVIHGWFKDPPVTVEGYHSDRSSRAALEELAARMAQEIQSRASCQGSLIARLGVSASGEVRSCRILTETLVDLERRGFDLKEAIQAARKRALAGRFPKRAGSSEITLPLRFNLPQPTEPEANAPARKQVPLRSGNR